MKIRDPHTSSNNQTRLVRTCCPAHNCGGRCLLVAHVSDGIITRLEADDRTYDGIDNPRLLACVRGHAYLRRQYHPDRLKYPLKRTGERGEARFQRISWEEALDTVAGEIQRVRETYGSSALFVPYGTGSYSNTNGSHLARRLFNLSGGHLGFYNNYSWACIQRATPTVYGTNITGNQRQDWLNSRYILMWGWNPAEMIDDTNSAWFIKLAREHGARVVAVDPRKTNSAVGLADEWIPIRPGTDAAMMSAMAFVMLQENLLASDFIATHCVGFDRNQMPPGCENQESYQDYLLGTLDGTPKTPVWAETITGVPRETIVHIAREYATIKPAILYQGYGMQRRAYGEQVVRAGCVLAAITGNVGISGGWASGLAFPPPLGGNRGTVFPKGENPVNTRIPVAAWTEAVLNGPNLGHADGLKGDPLKSSIKLIYAIATNALINQHMNINRSAAVLKDKSLVEFIVVQDQFLTPTARFADIVLPACTSFETWGVQDGWKYAETLLFMPKLVEPLGESRSDFRICAGIAERLGIGKEFSQGMDERQWVDWILDRYREDRFPGLPTVDEFLESNAGVFTLPIEEPAVAFTDFRHDPENNPLPTPSGKIEIFSIELLNLNQPGEIPPVPKYIQEWESPFGPEAEYYPLQVVGSHALQRVHSTHDNNDWLVEAFPQRVFLNPIDAEVRKIRDGEMVRVFNDRGEMVLPCRVTLRIMPGVVNIPQGAWWSPDQNGIDHGGSTNVLTAERLTPLAFGNAQHTIMVQIERIGKARR
ncbi:MAG: molybdopterin-dependent oxidoreductase [Anaerolineales bacterium]|nr:molybdopterin-dependent oxidoreductase [Anaerolineales bacterium]